MRKKIFIIIFSLLFTSVVCADIDTHRPALTVEESDGSPSGRPRTFKVDNGSLTDNLDNTFTLSIAAIVSDDALLLDQSAGSQTVSGGSPAFNGGTSGVSAPFTVDSTFLVSNLNADLLDGSHASAFQLLDADLTAIAALGFASTSFLKKTAADTWALDTNTYQTTLTNSAGLLAALSDETGTGLAVFATSPTLTTPTIGAATATSIAIGANTLTTSEWAFLDGQDQTLATTSSPQFANLVITAGGDIKPSANSTTAINIAQADGTNFATFDSTNKQVLIGSNPDASATYPFDTYKRSTGTTMQQVGQFGVGGDGSPAAGEGVSINLGVPYTTSLDVQINAGYVGLVRPDATAANYGGEMVFGTRTTGAATAERMRIDTNGNVGIGTTTPGAKLHVSSGGGESVVRIGDTESTNVPVLQFRTAAANYAWVIAAQKNVSNALEFTPSTAVGGTTFSTPVMTLLQTGNVGIGTASPDTLLEVEGSAPTFRINDTGWQDWTFTAGHPSSVGTLTISRSGGATAVMTLNENGGSGRVGIGIAPPVHRLDVYSNVASQNVLHVEAGSLNTSPAIQVDAAAGRVMAVNKSNGGETIFYLVQNDTYNNKAIEFYGGGETPLLFEVNGSGNIWTVGDCSALTFTDRTPYPKTLQEAYDSVLSMGGIDGKVDHAKLNAFVKSVNVKTEYNPITKLNEDKGTETGRNLSATVSAQNAVIKDLLARITALENK